MKSVFVSGKKSILCGVIAVVVLCAVFFVLFYSNASAESGDMLDVRGYEQVLIRPGDTLDGLAKKYSGIYSHVSPEAYKNQIILLNDLDSDYIREGIYLMMPVCKSVSK